MYVCGKISPCCKIENNNAFISLKPDWVYILLNTIRKQKVAVEQLDLRF